MSQLNCWIILNSSHKNEKNAFITIWAEFQKYKFWLGSSYIFIFIILGGLQKKNDDG